MHLPPEALKTILLDKRLMVSPTTLRVTRNSNLGLGFLGFRVLGFRVKRLGFRVADLRFRV